MQISYIASIKCFIKPINVNERYEITSDGT